MSQRQLQLQWSYNGSSHQLTFDDQQTISLGRQAEINEIVLPDSKIAAKQALIYCQDGQIQLLNISLAQRIFICHSGARTPLYPQQVARLEPEIWCQIGKFKLTCHFVEARPALKDVRIICPACERAIPAQLRTCPYDGTSLAGGQVRLVTHPR